VRASPLLFFCLLVVVIGCCFFGFATDPQGGRLQNFVFLFFLLVVFSLFKVLGVLF